MHIRRLARNAAFITIAAMVTGGFLTGIAEATNVAPTSTVSAVTSGGARTPRMLPNCNPPAVCTFASSIRGIILIQKFPCTANRHYGGIQNPIFEIANLCSAQVYWYNPRGHCMSPNSAQAGTGRFGTVTSIGVTGIHRNC
jgi:hypothetical protein